MNNLELLKKFGFVEKDGWLLDPKLNEQMFKIDDPVYGVDKSPEEIMKIIVACSFNAGVRWKKEEIKQNFHSHISEFIDDL